MSNNMISIHVKQDGTGDFTEIQAAINSINDASESKQYTVYVHDDIFIDDLTKLWNVYKPERVSDPSEINGQTAVIITKHWVNVVGVGAPKTIEIVSPKDLPVKAYQYIQVIYPMGNCVIDNFRFIITGGRYAIHQEAGGSKTSQDYWATTTYKNIYAEHKGNHGYPEGVWKSVYAQANGTTSGSKMVHYNCEWKANDFPPYYTHANKEFDGKNMLVFDSCKMHINILDDVRWSDLGSGFQADVIIKNSDIGFFKVTNQPRGTEEYITNADNWEDGGAVVSGGGNTIMPTIEETPETLYFESTKIGKDIRVIGGDAAELIIGGEMARHDATEDRPGAFWSKKRIQQVPDGLGKTRVFSLAHRLGNCADCPKSLVLDVAGEEVLIMFDKNYVTKDNSPYSWDTDPVISTEQIVDEINKTSKGLFTCSIGKKLLRIYSFRDCMTSVRNKTAETIDLGCGLVRDYNQGLNSYRLSMAGEIPDAIAPEKIPVFCSQVPSDFNGVLFHKAIFRGSHLGLHDLKAGCMIKTTDHGKFEQTDNPDEAVMIALDEHFLRAVDKRS